MRVVLAAICTFAEERNGLLTIVSAVVNRLRRSGYPAPLGLMLALQFRVSPREVGHPIEIQIRLEDADGGRVAYVTGAFQIDRLPPDHDPGEMLLVPFVQRFEC